MCVEEGVGLLAEAGIDRLRAKGMALTSLAVDLADAWLAPLGFTVASPRDPGRRGSHVTLAHPDAERIVAGLIAGAASCPTSGPPTGSGSARPPWPAGSWTCGTRSTGWPGYEAQRTGRSEGHHRVGIC